jgi:NAD+ kinase
MIAVTGHFERSEVKRTALKAKKLLEGFGAKCVFAGIEKKPFNFTKAEAVVAVGGDGTLLRVVREMKKQKPVLGIAAGSLGALMQVKGKGLGKAMQKLAKGKFKVEKRARLSVFCDGKKMPPALNEAMLVNRESGSIACFKLSIGKKSRDIKADGIIIATPTGSTGHAFSAGAKKLSHKSKRLAVAASNPLQRGFKPVYPKDGSSIRLSGFEKGQSLELVIDGRIRKRAMKSVLAKKGAPALMIKF